MRADPLPVDAFLTANDRPDVPFACEYVTITKQEHIRLKIEAQRWQILHRKALGRSQWREQRYARILRELKAQAERTQAKLRLKLEEQRAKVRDLQKRLFGGKSERHKGCELRCQGDVSRAHRGQRRGARGHGRTMQSDLPVRHEELGLTQAHCSHCGLAFRIFPGTEDSEILEIEVKAYRRAVHRRRYQAACKCCSLPGVNHCASTAQT